jgi:hypothetical protein
MLFSIVIKSFKSARRFDTKLIYSCFQIDIKCFVFKLKEVKKALVSVGKAIVSVGEVVVSVGELLLMLSVTIQKICLQAPPLDKKSRY